jgi:hypothetical protein
MLKNNSVSIETVPPPAQTKNSSFKHRGKIIVPLFVAMLIVVLAVAFFIPKGSATIPLTVNFVVGEVMTYDTSITAQIQGLPIATSSNSGPLTVKGTETIEIQSDDGQYYTLVHSSKLNSPSSNVPFQYTVIEKMNKTGYSTYFLNMGDTQISIPTDNGISGNSYLAQLLSQPEAKIGETIIVPYPSQGISGITGNLKITFNAPEDLTVAGKTFSAFKIDIVSDGLALNTDLPTTIPGYSMPPVSATINIHFQIYLEYGTLKTLKSTMSLDETVQSSGLNMGTHLTIESTLTQNTKP